MRAVDRDVETVDGLSSAEEAPGPGAAPAAFIDEMSLLMSLLGSSPNTDAYVTVKYLVTFGLFVTQ